MKKQKTRYYTEDKLILAIDRLTERIEARMAKAEGCDKEATYLYHQLSLVSEPEILKGPELVAYLKTKALAKDYRDYAEMVRRNQPRYNAKLARYKEALGKIRTIPFSFLDDASVTVCLLILALAIIGCKSVPKQTNKLQAAPPIREAITIYTPNGDVKGLMFTPDLGRPKTAQIKSLLVYTPNAVTPDILPMESSPAPTIRKVKALDQAPLYDFYWSRTGGMERFAPGTMPERYK